MLTRITFVMERGSNRRYSHLITEDGVCHVVQRLDACSMAKVGVFGDSPNHDQLNAMAFLCEMAIRFNPAVVFEFLEGLSPFSAPAPHTDGRQGDMFTVPPPTGQ